MCLWVKNTIFPVLLQRRNDNIFFLSFIHSFIHEKNEIKRRDMKMIETNLQPTNKREEKKPDSYLYFFFKNIIISIIIMLFNTIWFSFRL